MKKLRERFVSWIIGQLSEETLTCVRQEVESRYGVRIVPDQKWIQTYISHASSISNGAMRLKRRRERHA